MVERDRETERLIRKGRERPHILLVMRKTRQTWRNKRAGVQSYSSRKKNFSRQRRKPTTNSTRIWHCYLCPPPQLSVPVSDTGLFCLGRGGWLVYTAYGITFRIRTRAHWRRRVFSAAHYSTPPPPHNKEFFFSHLYTYIFTTGSSPASPPSGTVLLSTRIHYGVISYKQGVARFWNDNRTWRPPDDVVQVLKERWASTAYATVEFKTDDNGVATPTVKESLADNIWNNCSVS